MFVWEVRCYIFIFVFVLWYLGTWNMRLNSMGSLSSLLVVGERMSNFFMVAAWGEVRGEG